MVKAAPQLPIHVTRNIGVNLRPLAGIPLVLALQSLLTLASGRPMVDELMHGSTIRILGAVTVFLVALVILFQTKTTLDIDQSGVTVSTKKTRYVYAWPDISDVVLTPKAIRLELAGRSFAENRNNLISAQFGVDLDVLAAALNEGVARWGTPQGQQTGMTRSPTRSVAPDPQQVASATFVRATLVQGLLMGAIFCGIVVWQVGDYLKTSELQRNGEPTTAHVVRFYTDLCGRRGCSEGVEYSYAAGAAGGKTYTGSAYLAGSGYRADPDYISARDSQTVPIVFDKTDPGRSGLNFRNVVFSGDTLSSTLIMIGTAGLVMLSVFAFMAALMWQALRTVDGASAVAPSSAPLVV